MHVPFGFYKKTKLFEAAGVDKNLTAMAANSSKYTLLTISN